MYGARSRRDENAAMLAWRPSLPRRSLPMPTRPYEPKEKPVVGSSVGAAAAPFTGVAQAFAAGGAERPDALLVLTDPLFNTALLARITELAIARQVPTFAGWRVYVEAGFLASYGPDLNVMATRAAAYVQKILRGARPGDLPVEQPTKFELVFNAKTAQALGLAIPPSLLARADEVIR